MEDVKRLKIVEGICLALNKINLLSSYTYKLAEFIDKDNPEIVISDIEKLINKDTEIEEIAIRLRFRDSVKRANDKGHTENSIGSHKREAQGVVI